MLTPVKCTDYSYSLQCLLKCYEITIQRVTDYRLLSNRGILRCLLLSPSQLVSCSTNICCVTIRIGTCKLYVMSCLFELRYQTVIVLLLTEQETGKETTANNVNYHYLT